MVLECVNHFVEFVVSKSFDFVVSSGKVQPCNRRFGFLIEDVYEFKGKSVGFFEIRELFEKNFCLLFLLFIPL